MQSRTGVIEGFFGREWTWQERADYAAFLAQHGYSYYIYAPKGDRHLRQDWSLPWPAETAEQVRGLRQAYKAAGVEFGVGLSPFDVQQNYNDQARTDLMKKVEELNGYELDILCVLFDDMKGDVPNLAQTQADIVHRLAEKTNASHLICCPSYYSTDPVLERVFGKMPENYLEDLGRLLDPSVDIFWTGPLVCSVDYPREHLKETAQLLGRKPFLWDNYPVNDGAKKCNHLHLKAFRAHPIADLIAGHAVNPMNQPWLSRLPLSTLRASYGDDYRPEAAWSQSLEQVGALGSALEQDLERFHDQGLLEIDTASLAKKYRDQPDSPYRKEILEWLEGGYEFDPACLTD